MHRMFFIFLLITLTACSQISSINEAKETKGHAIASKSVETLPVEVEVHNGKVKYIEFPVSKPDGTYKVFCTEVGTTKPLKKSFPFSVRDQIGFFYYAESYFSIAKKHECRFENKVVLNVNVKQFPYKKEKLKVDKRRVVLSKKDLKRVLAERKITAKIYENSADNLFFDSDFTVPLDSYITSYYGNQRIFNNMKKSQHLGNDFRAKVGVKIPAANKGKVVYVGDLFYTGNVVIIDHGLNIFSIYAHLSKILTTKGSIVNKGDIIGLSGMTGRVSGPHLHWGIKVNGHNVDGFSIVKESQRQFAPDEIN